MMVMEQGFSQDIGEPLLMVMVTGGSCLPLGQAVGRWVSQFVPRVWDAVIAQGRQLCFHVRR